MADKDRRGRAYLSGLLTILLCLLIMGGGITAQEDSNTKENQNPASVAQPEIVSVFFDRTTLKAGESLKLVVQCEPPYTLLPETEIVLSKSFQKEREDTPNKIEYLIAATPKTQAGKYNIQVRVKYKVGPSKDAPLGTIIREIKNLDVQKGSRSESLKTLTGLIPIIVGALLGFTASLGTSLFNAWREQQKKEKWILNTFLPQLQVAQKDIAKGEPVGYEIWMSEFYRGGYYAALQKLSERLEGKPDLCSDIVAVHSLFKRYEKGLGAVAGPGEAREDLNRILSRVIGALSRSS